MNTINMSEETTTTEVEKKVLYTAKDHTTGVFLLLVAARAQEGRERFGYS